MATITHTHSTLDRPAIRSVVGALLAGMVYGMWTMMVEAVLHAGQGVVQAFFSPVVYIAATVLGGFGNPTFYPVGQLPSADPAAIVFGLMGHMINSFIFGVIFLWLVDRFIRADNSRILAGLIYGVIVFLAMWYLVTPVVDPVMTRVNYLGFLAGHMMYGIGLGLTANWVRRAYAY
jgi:uncharacterized membrane protein YagU involved in acid resistance